MSPRGSLPRSRIRPSMARRARRGPSRAAPFDPQMIAGLANAFFQAPPASLASARFRSVFRSRRPIFPTRPRRPSSPRRAIRAGARTARPPDIPPTTIPRSCRRRTFRRRAPRRRCNPRRAARPRRRAAAGRLGGRASPSAAPTDIDYSAIPRLLAATWLWFRRPTRAPGVGEGAAAFPADRRPRKSTISIFCMTARHWARRERRRLLRAFSGSARRSGPSGWGAEDFVILGLRSRSHRFSDAAALATRRLRRPCRTVTRATPRPARPGRRPATALFRRPLRRTSGARGTAPAQAKEERKIRAATPRQLGSRSRTLRSLSRQARLPDPATAGARKSADLARQRRDDAKAASVIDRLSHFYEYENSNIHRAATRSRRARPTPMKPARKSSPLLRAPSVKDSSSFANHRGINLVAQAGPPQCAKGR